MSGGLCDAGCGKPIGTNVPRWEVNAQHENCPDPPEHGEGCYSLVVTCSPACAMKALVMRDDFVLTTEHWLDGLWPDKVVAEDGTVYRNIGAYIDSD